MDSVAAKKILSFPEQGAESWIDTYREEILRARDEATIEIYTRILEKFAQRLALCPGNAGQFRPEAITRTAIESFLETLPSFSSKKQVRAALSGFCRWLQEDQKLLERNPVRGVSIPGQTRLSPRELSTDQRYVIRGLVEREADLRDKVAFALGYFAGCRVSDVSWLRLDATHVSPQGRVDHGGTQGREGTDHRFGQ